MGAEEQAPPRWGGKKGQVGVVESKNREAAKRFEAEETESDWALLLLLLSPRFCATQFILDFKSFCCFTPKERKKEKKTNSRILKKQNKTLKGARIRPSSPPNTPRTPYCVSPPAHAL